ELLRSIFFLVEGIDRFIFYDLEPIHLIDAPIRLRDKLLIARLIRLAKEKGKAYRDDVQSTSDSEDFDNL
uniref:Uncharacterized protein n=1 Tax=Lutzomyia longipalpis TaxID=7200 RepID=A0A1B0FV47_LUTLO